MPLNQVEAVAILKSIENQKWMYDHRNVRTEDLAEETGLCISTINELYARHRDIERNPIRKTMSKRPCPCPDYDPVLCDSHRPLIKCGEIVDDLDLELMGY